MLRTASCACGNLSITVAGAPAMHGICHCRECQKLSGSPFWHHGYWPRAAIRGVQGESTVWRRIAESGRWVDTGFCTGCGSALYSYAEFEPEAICVGIGHFADPSFPPPQYSVWERWRHPWVNVPDGCVSYATQP